MNMTTGSCGHPVPAVGSPDSIARKRCESEPCYSCRAIFKEKLEAIEAKIIKRVNDGTMDADDEEALAIIQMELLRLS